MNRLTDYQTFLSQFLRNYGTTGAVVPSGRALGNALCQYVGKGTSQQILEAGPGTGAVTGCIVDRMRRDDELWMVELNPTFAAHLRTAFASKPAFRTVSPQCHLIEGSVQQLGHERHFDVVVSGLPLNNFSSDQVRDILEAYGRLLKPGGILSFFQYMMVRPAKMIVSGGAERTRLKGVGDTIERVLREREFAREWIWANVPPAWVHHIRF
jgi:phosphatidylethanolamine/phosphatidyl-N-methylethanolamine N-methyltransferase